MAKLFETHESGFAVAVTAFNELCAQKAFSSSNVSNFHIQPLNDGSYTVCFGAVGTVAQDGGFLPVADVLGAFRLTRESLDQLGVLIGAFRNQQSEPVPRG